VSDPQKLTIFIDEGRLFEGFGAPVRRLIHPNTVGSELLGVSICMLEPGQRIRNHRHATEEAYFVLRGTGSMYLEREEEIRLMPGLAVYIPAGRAHGQVNDGTEPLHILGIITPPPIEGDPPIFDEEV
jgi:quercetin dioxygenase-like cupin family protein